MVKERCCCYVRFLFIKDENFKGLNIRSQRIAQLYKSFKGERNPNIKYISQWRA